jgi:hypothetical protein
MAITAALVVLIVLFLVVVGFIVFAFYLYNKNKNKIRIPVNANIVVNFATEFTDGWSHFLELNAKKNQDGRVCSMLLPRDLDNIDSDKVEIPKIQYLVTSPGCRIVIPKGVLSKNRNTVFCMPSKPEYMTTDMRNNILGKALMGIIDYETDINMINQRVVKMREALSKTAIKGEETLSKVLLDNLDQIAESIRKLYSKTDEKKPFNPSSFGNYPPAGFGG